MPVRELFCSAIKTKILNPYKTATWYNNENLFMHLTNYAINKESEKF